MTSISRVLRLKWFAKTMTRKILPLGFIFFLLCGYISEVGAQTHAVDGEYITDWLLLGPFFLDHLQTDFLADVSGEVDIDPKAGDTVTTPKGETLTWERYQTKSDFVDLRHAIGNHQSAIAYAFCTLQSETDGRIQTLLGSDDGVTVWINGKQVHHNPVYRPLSLDEDAFEANLQAGDNRCLVKVSQNYGSWSFSVRGFPSGQPVLITPKLSLSADQFAYGNDSILLSATEWKYHPGDDLSWAHPEFDDSSWESVNTLLPSHRPPQSGWQSIGWFRLHLAVDTTLLNTPLALSIWQVGASEIYLDGNRLYQFGVVGQSKAEEKANLQREPKAISFASNSHHVLAVRYSNFTANTFGAKIHRASDNTGFAVSLTDLNRAIERRVRQVRVGKTHQIFLTSVLFTIGFLHLLLFLFDRRSMVNLYYAVSIICFAFGIFANFHFNFFSTTPAQRGGALIGFAGGMIATIVFGLFTIYSELYAKLPRRSYVFLSVGTQ